VSASTDPSSSESIESSAATIQQNSSPISPLLLAILAIVFLLIGWFDLWLWSVGETGAGISVAAMAGALGFWAPFSLVIRTNDGLRRGNDSGSSSAIRPGDTHSAPESGGRDLFAKLSKISSSTGYAELSISARIQKIWGGITGLERAQLGACFAIAIAGVAVALNTALDEPRRPHQATVASARPSSAQSIAVQPRAQSSNNSTRYVVNSSQTVCSSLQALLTYLRCSMQRNYRAMEAIVRAGTFKVFAKSQVLSFTESYEFRTAVVIRGGDSVDFVKLNYPTRTLWALRASTNL